MLEESKKKRNKTYTHVDLPMPQPAMGRMHQGGRKRWMAFAKTSKTLL